VIRKALTLCGAIVATACIAFVSRADSAVEGEPAAVQQGGTFRINHAGASGIDPALIDTVLAGSLLRATCALLVNYADKPLPAGLGLVPDAAGLPQVSRDGKTYTFVIRPGLRFSDGAPLTAENFARAFARVFAPSMKSFGAEILADVVGAKNVREGSGPTGIDAQGNRLTIRLTRPVPDLLDRLTSPYFCAVPPNLPIDREGVGAPLHSAGPYYVSEFVRGRRIVLSRNTNYRGTRPQNVDQMVVDLTAASLLEALNSVRSGRADWTPFLDRVQFEKIGELARAYGVGRARFFLEPGFYLVGFYLNTKGTLLRDNVSLRRALNFAIDRPALLGEVGSRVGGLTDQYLPPTVRGFRDVRIYPLRAPDVARARALARGNLRSGKAALYITNDPVLASQAQILKKNFAKIGLEVTVTKRTGSAHFKRIFTPGEPWDIASFGWAGDSPDPAGYLNALFEAGAAFNPGFDAPEYNRALARAARLRGAARYRAYGELDVRLARDAAPYIAAHYANEPTLVSGRVLRRCVVLNPNLDLAAVCLR
jgi:ABC-type transport system substrate-binding protein